MPGRTGGEGRALDAKLVHHFKGRIHVGLLPLHVRLNQRNAVEVHAAFKIDAAADLLGPCAALHAGRQKDELVDLAGVAAQLDRERVQHTGLERGADLGLGGIERQAVSRYLDRLRDGAGNQPNVDGRRCAHLDANAVPQVTLEAGSLNGQQVQVRLQTGKRVSAHARRYCVRHSAGRLIGQGQLGSGNHRAIRVSHRAGDAAESLRLSLPSKKGHQQTENQQRQEQIVTPGL